ncbi:MAG: methionyl-tRNA formyltransferase [Parvularculaceae bacterium]|nr:methionyl-tRNA formyltransferase [Parvularculaceae bacterium]
MRLAFMGTPEIAATSLVELIAAGRNIAAVYTREPRPAGRGHRLTPSPVQKIAERYNIEVRTPKTFKSQATVDAFRALELDAAIVVAYGLILPKEVLLAPRHGCFNLHASLLPRWRGAAPIQRAIMAGDKITGVQVMRMEEGLDAGPILLSEAVEIKDNDTAQSLYDRLSVVGAQLLVRFLSALERGVVVETPQPSTGVTYASKIAAADARIDWSRPAREIDRQIRGLSPFPGAWFEAKGARIKALMSRTAGGTGPPGEILAANDRLIVACGEDAVELLKLQRAGKGVQDAASFLRGFSLSASDRL